MLKKQIILVDDSLTNLAVCKKALKDLYEVVTVNSAEKMFQALEKIIPELILLDVEMPGMNGYDAMRLLRQNESYKDIPVIFLSAMDDAQSEMEGLDLGAVDYIHKPFVNALLIKRIETHLAVIDGRKELMTLNESINKMLDAHTGGESQSEENAFMALVSKSGFYTRMGHEIRAPLNTIIEMIESSIKSEDIAHIKHCLGRADIETRLILEIIDDVLDAAGGDRPESGGA